MGKKAKTKKQNSILQILTKEWCQMNSKQNKVIPIVIIQMISFVDKYIHLQNINI